VIQENGKILNLCIIKTAARPVSADHPSKQGFLGIVKTGIKPPERQVNDFRAARPGDHFLSERPEK
jgi:hypothetical protein